MKKFLLILIFVCMSCGQLTSKRSGEIREKLALHYEQNCSASGDCNVSFRDLTGFEWEKACYFSLSVENDEIRAIIGTTFPENTYYSSRKLFFLNQGKIAHFDSVEIKEIDKPLTSGDYDFDFQTPGQKYLCFDPSRNFKIETIQTNSGVAYRLTCLNCQ